MRSTRAAARAWTIAIVVVAPFGCAEPPPVSFARGDDIPLGEITLRLMGWEEVPDLHAPISSLSPPAGEKAIVAFVRWEGLAGMTDAERAAFLENFLEDRLAVVDSDGFEEPAFTTMPRPWYHFNFTPGPVPREWAVIFHVWVDSEGFSLLLTHPDPGEGDFRVAIVNLS